MNCSEIDIKGYFFNELAASERAAAERHVTACGVCAEELDRLRITESALLALPEEEMPRRLVFAVQGGVERPASFWQRFWASGPKIGFASAAMLSCAILLHGFSRAAPPPAPVVEVRAAAVAELQSRLDLLERSVPVAVAEAEKRAVEKTGKLAAANEQRLANEYRAEVVALASQVEWLTKRMNVMRVAANYEVRQ
jgi:hypothetical protein